MDKFDTTPLSKQYATVNRKRMAYHEAGQGRSIVFLHGNPTSSYLWRNIIPQLTGHGRCLAPDLIGHGDSDKLDKDGSESYRFVEHRTYLDGLLSQLDLGDEIVFVIHDWGSALGFDWASRHQDRVAGIAFMEAIVRPLNGWDEFPAAARGIFEGFRSSQGESMVIDQNLFVEAVLPGSILRDLSPEELNEYRRPFLKPQHRRPTLTWPRQIPIAGEPPDVAKIVQSYADWLSTAELPKLFIRAEPGALLTGSVADYCRAWPNTSEVTVPGSHFIQEDSPHEIARAIQNWLSAELPTTPNGINQT